MATPRTPPAVARRYPTLRFLVNLYKAAGVVILAGGVLFGIYQRVNISRFGLMAGLIPMLTTILPSAVAGGTLWLIAEGVAVFIAIEENTRMIALRAAQPAPAAPQVEVSPISISRLLDQLAAGQAQTNQRLDVLIAALAEVRGGVGTGVQGIEAIAETSKATATIL
jgi:hypothetical protein